MKLITGLKLFYKKITMVIRGLKNTCIRYDTLGIAGIIYFKSAFNGLGTGKMHVQVFFPLMPQNVTVESATNSLSQGNSQIDSCQRRACFQSCSRPDAVPLGIHFGFFHLTLLLLDFLVVVRGQAIISNDDRRHKSQVSRTQKIIFASCV